MRCHKPLIFFDFYWRSFRLVEQEPADVYHAHDLNTLPVAALLARRTRGRLVYDSHELYTEISTLSRLERAVWRAVERLLIGRADRVITVCESIADELTARYDVRKPTVVLNCPRAAQHSVSPEDGNRLREKSGLLGRADPIILYQGGFAPNRGLETLIEAMAHLDRGVLVLMGWGRLEATLRDLVRDRGLSERVVIIEPVPQDVLLGYTSGADIGVIPYRAVGLNNYYTTPNKLFEYMGAGIAIAGSRFPEVVRFVEGLQIGATFDPEDARDVACTLERLMASPELLGRMRANALTSSKHFTWEEESVKLLAVYGEALSCAGTSRLTRSTRF
jgi:glycosyltransferase involved in cell wall biosynthesis